MNIHGFQRKLSLLIGTPNMGEWTAAYGMSLVNMMGHLMATPVPGFRQQHMKPMQVKGSIISRGRLLCVKEALKGGYTHLLFIDADQDFPRDTAHRLLQHGKDVVGCNIATKQIPATPTARRKSSHLGGEPVYTDPDSPSLERVWRLGCGIMLLDMRVFKTIGLNCWSIDWEEELQDYRGEDWSLCKALESAGFEIWVDHKLSDQVGHWGPYRYTHEVVGEKVLVEDKVIGEA
jgi:hypothetical protein